MGTEEGQLGDGVSGCGIGVVAGQLAGQAAAVAPGFLLKKLNFFF